MGTIANRRNLAAAALAAILLVSAPVPGVRAQDGGDKAGDKKEAPKKKDDRPVSGDDAAKMAIDRFESDFRTRDEGKRMNAIHSLSGTKNDLVTKKLGSLLAHRDWEIRSAAAMALDGMYQNTELAGEILRKHLASKKEDNEDVLITICLSIGRLNYTEAIPELGELADKSHLIFVKIEALKAFAKMKDTRALLPILELWLREPQGYSWEGGEVTYDSGAPGDADQKEAERQYNEKYGNQGRKGAPPTMLKTYIQSIVEAVAAITGEKLSNPTELMRWMVEHEKELPYKLPGKVKATLKDWEERARKREKQKEK